MSPLLLQSRSQLLQPEVNARHDLGSLCFPTHVPLTGTMPHLPHALATLDHLLFPIHTSLSLWPEAGGQ